MLTDNPRSCLQLLFLFQYGARPLNRVIQNEVLFPLSRMILDGSVREAETVLITSDPVANRLIIQPNHEPEIEMDDDDNSDVDDLVGGDEMEIEEIDD